MEIQSRCFKLKLPNGKVVDILTELVDEFSRYLQNSIDKPERGGYILGYQHKTTGNIVLEAITSPQDQDICSRVRCVIKHFYHGTILRKSLCKKSYYMGVWHTHPQKTPVPSTIDWQDWRKSVSCEKTGGDYIFFLIAGTDNFRVWIGDYSGYNISEIYEVARKGYLY